MKKNNRKQNKIKRRKQQQNARVLVETNNTIITQLTTAQYQ